VVLEDLPTVDQSDFAILSVYTSECPVGYTGSDYASDCGNPIDASIYTALVNYGTVPNSTTLESALNEYGYISSPAWPRIITRSWSVPSRRRSAR